MDFELTDIVATYLKDMDNRGDHEARDILKMIDNSAQNLDPRTILRPVGLFATPDDMQALEDYLSLFHGSEAIVANTCAWMSWNLAAKLTSPKPEPDA